MPSDLAMQKARQAWSMPETKHMTMNVKLATEFAIILDSYIEVLKPLLKEVKGLHNMCGEGCYVTEMVDESDRLLK